MMIRAIFGVGAVIFLFPWSEPQLGEVCGPVRCLSGDADQELMREAAFAKYRESLLTSLRMVRNDLERVKSARSTANLRSGGTP